MRRNQSLHYQYHQDQRHTTEDCRTLWDHLDQLVREVRLKQFLHHPSGQGGPAGLEPWRDASSRPSLGTINVIFAVPGRIGSHLSRVTSVARLLVEDFNSESKRARVETQPTLSFSNEDKLEPYSYTMML